MQLFSVDQQRSQALEAHAASFASFKVRFSHTCFLVAVSWWKTLETESFIMALLRFFAPVISYTGCRKWEPIYSDMLCLKDIQCWTNYIKVARNWTWCPARLLTLSFHKTNAESYIYLSIYLYIYSLLYIVHMLWKPLAWRKK